MFLNGISLLPTLVGECYIPYSIILIVNVYKSQLDAGWPSVLEWYKSAASIDG